jgi:hypothetical protein
VPRRRAWSRAVISCGPLPVEGRRAYRRAIDRSAIDREIAMGDKSPHDAHHSQKSAKSIKEKRAERKAKEQMTESQMARLAAEAKQHKH